MLAFAFSLLRGWSQYHVIYGGGKSYLLFISPTLPMYHFILTVECTTIRCVCVWTNLILWYVTRLIFVIIIVLIKMLNSGSIVSFLHRTTTRLSSLSLWFSTKSLDVYSAAVVVAYYFVHWPTFAHFLYLAKLPLLAAVFFRCEFWCPPAKFYPFLAGLAQQPSYILFTHLNSYLHKMFRCLLTPQVHNIFYLQRCKNYIRVLLNALHSFFWQEQ